MDGSHSFDFFYYEAAKNYKPLSVYSQLDNIEFIGKCFSSDYKAPELYHCASVKGFAPIFC